MLLASAVALGQYVGGVKIDFVARIENSPEVGADIGWAKLSSGEKQKLSDLLNAVYRAGRASATGSLGSSLEEAGLSVKLGAEPSGSVAFQTKIDSDEGEILRLENGAVVEVTSGYLGYVGYRKDAVLFGNASSWRIWIEGKKAFRCELIREPTRGSSKPAELVLISEVKGDGSLLVLDDGSLLEVDSIFTITTGLWLGLSDALLIDDRDLVNLDDGDEVVSVSRIR